MFASIYAAEAGNLALRTLPRRGLFLAGGIAPKILPYLRAPAFLASFLDKGRMRSLLDQTPVSVITSEHVGLLGARVAALSPALD